MRMVLFFDLPSISKKDQRELENLLNSLRVLVLVCFKKVSIQSYV